MNREIIYSQYTSEYISGVMSLRKPQKSSLDILFQILDKIKPSNNIDMADALEVINSQYPTCTDFEREFMSITFALATGERVIIVTGCINALGSRVSGTFIKIIHALLRAIRYNCCKQCMRRKDFVSLIIYNYLV